MTIEEPARGRVKTADLIPGERYFAVYTPTGVCCFKTRNETEAQEIVARNPDKLSYVAHHIASNPPSNR